MSNIIGVGAESVLHGELVATVGVHRSQLKLEPQVHDLLVGGDGELFGNEAGPGFTKEFFAAPVAHQLHCVWVDASNLLEQGDSYILAGPTKGILRHHVLVGDVDDGLVLGFADAVLFTPNIV